MMKRILLGVMVVMVTAVVAGPVAVAQETYKIGAVLSVTGPASYLGEDERNTLQLLQDQVNARGGIGGKKVDIVIYDDASDPTKSVTALRRLHEEDKVLAVIGGSISGNSLAMIPFSEKASVPQLVPAASAKISNPIKKWVFQFCSTDVQAITLILNFLKAKGVTSIAMLSDSTAYGVSGKEELERQAPGQGFKVVAWETFGPTDTDMTAQLAHIKASGARAVLVWNATPASAIVAKNFKQLGLDALQIQSTAYVSVRQLELAGDAAEGIYLSGYKIPVVNQLPASDPQKKLLTEFREVYTKRFGREPNAYAALAYDAFTALVKVLPTAGADRDKIRQGLEGLKNFVAAAGIYTISPTDHNGFQVESMPMLVVEKGAFRLVNR
jgi:branched-chain amino acid transport system substrate-binding protein